MTLTQTLTQTLTHDSNSNPTPIQDDDLDAFGGLEDEPEEAEEDNPFEGACTPNEPEEDNSFEGVRAPLTFKWVVSKGTRTFKWVVLL